MQFFKNWEMSRKNQHWHLLCSVLGHPGETVMEELGLCLPVAVAPLLSVGLQSWGSVIVTNWFAR